MEVEESKSKVPICVYFLQNYRCSYIGFTTDLFHRFRQHLGELAGGAKCTSRWANKRDTRLVAFVAGFPDKRTALSFEWHAKRRRRAPKVPLGRTESQPHSRLTRFLEPLLLDKFAWCRDRLKVMLLEHPELEIFIRQNFHVQCEALEDDLFSDLRGS